MKSKIFDRKYFYLGYVAGVDEVGRGALAGPLVVCAIIMKKSYRNKEIKDSKMLNAKKREELYQEILDHAVAVATVIIDHEEIDRINIFEATKKAMRQAIADLSVQPNMVLVDAVELGLDNTLAIIRGDQQSFTISCASIIAKVTRDRLMVAYDQTHPGYHFAENKGYGTPEHLVALDQIGPCPIHRRTYAPVRQAMQLKLF